mmetsp:Transcript_10451/g.14773  ORF Transcript_10451/g.14773 Transcript_10451/m.14773 type:complete len:421 (+) Transcript_10451:52-1314(+)
MTTNLSIQDRSLLVLILDITPTCWGERQTYRERSDQARLKAGKRSLGPAVLSEVISSVQTFVLAFSALHRENCIVVIGVADSEVAVVYPRKGIGMESMVGIDSRELGSSKIDPKEFHEGFMLGVAELVARSARKAEERAIRATLDAKTTTKEDGVLQEEEEARKKFSSSPPGSAMAAATSLALCIINRFSVNASGLSNLNNGGSLLHRKEDAGVLAMISQGSSHLSADKANARATEERMEQRRARGMLSPRILAIQALEDKTRDYNAFMNCSFAASKGDIVIDGCFLASGMNNRAKTSTFLEQACDRTGGVFSKLTGTAQVSGGLTEVLMTVFLPPLSVRKKLNLPKLNEVDFRAKCFETGDSVDQGYVCNQCLSIFKNQPKNFCLTCGAQIYIRNKSKIETQSNSKYSNVSDSKRIKIG